MENFEVLQENTRKLNTTNVNQVSSKPDNDIVHKQTNSCDILHQSSSSDTNSFKYSSRPAVWGPKFWYILHNGSVHYPEQPTNLAMHRMHLFLKTIPYFLPCGDCRNHAIDFINSVPDQVMNKHLSSKQALVSFFVDFHNHVNVRTGKQKVDTNVVYSNIEKIGGVSQVEKKSC